MFVFHKNLLIITIENYPIMTSTYCPWRLHGSEQWLWLQGFMFEILWDSHILQVIVSICFAYSMWMPCCAIKVFDVYESSTVASWGLPPLACIVMERGNFTLSEWLQRHQPGLDHMDQRSILFKICKAVQYFHENGIVHR